MLRYFSALAILATTTFAQTQTDKEYLAAYIEENGEIEEGDAYYNTFLVVPNTYDSSLDIVQMYYLGGKLVSSSNW